MTFWGLLVDRCVLRSNRDSNLMTYRAPAVFPGTTTFSDNDW